jgi:putative hemin transport protein
MAQALESSPATDPAVQGDLLARWQAFRRQHPKVRIRDAAIQLGVSEAQLVATGCGESATRLKADWGQLVGGLHRLGQVMALTRNEHAVHERHGIYGRPVEHGSIGILLGEIDLRLFYSRWHHGFAVREESVHGTRDSLQFFDQSGNAVHKVYLTDDSDREAYANLVAAYRDPDQRTGQTVLPPAPAPSEIDDAQVDINGLQAHWNALQDTHDFNDLLRRFAVGRRQALRLVDDSLAVAVGNDAARRLLERVALRQVEIMVFVASPGVIQIHTGPVVKLAATGPWFNVLDPTFNLHLRETAIADSYLVRKPTRDGTVSSLELFDRDGGLICQLFGRRKPGQVEDAAWRDALGMLEPGVVA